jgi:hypothetical protein
MQNDLENLRTALSKQIEFIAQKIEEDPSKLHRSATLTAERLLKMYLQLRKLYAGDKKDVKITVELVGTDETKSNQETLGNTGKE